MDFRKYNYYIFLVIYNEKNITARIYFILCIILLSFIKGYGSVWDIIT